MVDSPALYNLPKNHLVEIKIEIKLEIYTSPGPHGA